MRSTTRENNRRLWQIGVLLWVIQVLLALLFVFAGGMKLAAAGLVIVMIGATTLSQAGGIVAALIPLTVGLLCAFVAYGRWRLAPHRGVSRLSLSVRQSITH
jgi:hypothetical protein